MENCSEAIKDSLQCNVGSRNTEHIYDIYVDKKDNIERSIIVFE